MILWNKQAALGDAVRGAASQLARQFTRRLPVGQGCGESAGNLRHLFTRLVDKVQAEMAYPHTAPCVQVLAGRLCLGSEHGVAAAHVGHDRVRAPLDIAQCHAMFLTRVATVLVAGALRQKAAEDAMFGVEDGEMLVGHDLDPVRADVRGQRGHLRGVQVVGGRQARQAQPQETCRRQHIRRVQAEIADQRRMRFVLERVEQATRPHNDRAVQLEQEAYDPLLVRLAVSTASTRASKVGKSRLWVLSRLTLRHSCSIGL